MALEFTSKVRWSLFAAALGGFSFFLPWVGVRVPYSFNNLGGVSPAQLVASLVTPSNPFATTDPALQAWEQSAAAGTGLWTIGAIMFALGCGLALAQAFESIRWAGFEMLFGVGLSAIGILSLPRNFPVGGNSVYVEPALGLWIAFAASFLALIPFFRRASEDDWTRKADVGFATRDPMTLHLRALNAGLTPVSPPAHPELRLEPSEEPSPAPPPTSRRFCPTCGRWYLGDETACGRDGTPLKPVASDAGETGLRQP